jgi:DNA-binding transcriptional LysR family regulator
MRVLVKQGEHRRDKDQGRDGGAEQAADDRAPHGCSARQLLESAFLQRGLPFVSAVEAEGYELHLSLIADGVGLGLVMPQVIQSSAMRKRLKQVTVKGLSPMQNVWIIHSKHIGRLASAVQCVREAVKQQLRTH